MSNEQRKREALFELHSAHLFQYFRLVDTFICPICLGVFNRDDLARPEVLTIGHVWTEEWIKYLRNSGRKDVKANQKVLLCKPCNNKGSINEQQIIEYYKVKDGYVNGDMYKAKLSYNTGPNAEVRSLLGYKLQVTDANTNTYEIHVPYARQKPEQQGEVDKQLIEDLYKPDGSINIYAHQQAPSISIIRKVKISLLTSAYLLLFYKLQYSYILQPELEEIREIIRSPSGGNVRMLIDEHLAERVTVCDCHYTSVPMITFNFPIAKRAAYVEVMFLNHHVYLPYPLAFSEDPIAKDAEFKISQLSDVELTDDLVFRYEFILE